MPTISTDILHYDISLIKIDFDYYRIIYQSIIFNDVSISNMKCSG